MRFAVLTCLACLLVSACGGNVVVDHGGGGSAGSGPLVACDGLGIFVAVGFSCSPEGQTCALPGVCCAAPLQCEHGRWVMTPANCHQPCDACGDGLSCELGALCVEQDRGSQQNLFRCADDPCQPGQPLDCMCAAAACAPESACLGRVAPNKLQCATEVP
jgi:hypothetical protein